MSLTVTATTLTVTATPDQARAEILELMGMVEKVLALVADNRVGLLLIAALCKPSTQAELAHLRVGEVPALVEALKLPAKMKILFREKVREYIHGRSPEELVYKSRVHGGREPVSRMTLWRVLSPLTAQIEIWANLVLKAVRTLATRVQALSHYLAQTVSEKIQTQDRSPVVLEVDGYRTRPRDPGLASLF